MKRWLRAARTASLTVFSAAALGACGGGGGGGVITLHFGTNGLGSCSQVVVDVDLEAASAVLEKLSNGDPNCTIEQILEDAGCDADFETLDNGGTLRARITGCTVPPVTSLFRCGFTSADLSEFGDVAFAQCTCTSEDCDASPPLCVSADDDPGSCEDCDNGRDDDANGDVDCDDANCEHAEGCEPETTTTTTTSTTITTTTTTTTTLLDCDVVFRLVDDVTAGSLQWLTDYSAVDGAFAGNGENVDCEILAEGTLAAINHDAGDQTLDSALVKVDGVDGPADLTRCHMRVAEKPEVGDFDISNIEVATPELDLIPDADIVVSAIDCGEEPTTTTTTSTTTTTDTVPPENVKVVFQLTASSAPLGALQILVDYTAAGGDFQGSGPTVNCVNKVSGALFAPNDVDATHKLSLGFIALSAFSAPTDVAECSFSGSSATAENFVVTVEDAADANSDPATASVGVSVIAAP